MKRSSVPLPLFAPRGTLMPADVGPFLGRAHYIGAAKRGLAYHDELGVMVFGNPTSRRLPQGRWVELIRWCIEAESDSAGSRQWSRSVGWLRRVAPAVTTVVSYSDPAVGHHGGLYRSCNWLWAPTWLRLRPPPTGNGSWGGGAPKSVKDRWVYPLRRDPERQSLLGLASHPHVRAAFPWAEYQEPRWKRNRWHGGGGDFRRFCELKVAA